MAVSVTHAFVSGLADDAGDATAGKVVPSNWNAAHTVTGALDAASNLSDLASAATARTNLGLGSAATTSAGDYATAAQGTTADAAVARAGDTMTGALAIASGTLTANAPALDVTQTWNNGAVTFTGLRMNTVNTASGAYSLLLDLQLGGVSRFRVATAGTVYCESMRELSDTIGFGYLAFTLGNLSKLGWSSTVYTNGGNDVGLYRNSAGTLEINDGVTAGTFRDLIARYVGTNPTVVASLPSAAAGNKGYRAFVTDATATTFLSTVAGGGSNNVPVVSDGTNWVIG